MISELALSTDPLLDLIIRYRHQCDLYNIADGTDDDLDRLYGATVKPLWLEFRDHIPSATTYSGAGAAVRLCVEDMEIGDSDIQRPLVQAALAYFDREAR